MQHNVMLIKDQLPMRFFTEIQLSENMGETPEGFLICYNVPIARTGIQVYKADETPIEPDASGLVQIDREPDEVFRPETIASFEGKTITINHPEDFVTPENWKEHACGTVTNVRRGIDDQADLLLSDMIINTDEAIKLVRAGWRQVSCGYDASYIQTDKGHGRQVNIIGNHVALVSKGRAGSRCAIMDSQKEVVQMKKAELKTLFVRFLDSIGIKDEDTEEEKKKKEETEDVEGFMAGGVFHPIRQSEGYKASEAGESKRWKSGKKAATKRAARTKTSSYEKRHHDSAMDAEGEEPDFYDMDELMGEMMDKIDSLEDRIAELVNSDKDVHKEVASEDAEEFEPEKKKEEEEKKKESEDCAMKAKDAASRAEILVPGMTTDGIKTNKDLLKFKREALMTAYKTEDGRAIIYPFTHGTAIATLPEHVIDAAFIGASEVMRHKNNGRFAPKTVVTPDFGSASSIHDINKKNASFWASRRAK